MKARDLVVIVLKVLGLYVLLQFIGVLPMTLALARKSFDMEDGGGAGTASPHLLALSMMLIPLVYVGGAAVLLLGARRLSRFFVENPDAHLSIPGSVTQDITALSFQCVGVYALVTWTPGLIQTLFQCIVYASWTQPATPFLRRFYDNWSGLISPVAGTLLGLFLIFRTGGLVRLIRLSRPMNEVRPEDRAE